MPIVHSGSKYASRIAQMKAFQPAQYEEIRHKIQALYKDHVYLLMEGDLEAYL